MTFTNIDRPSAPQVPSSAFTRLVTPDDLPWDGDCEAPKYLVGVQAIASIAIPIGQGSFHLMELSSAGLWGVGVDNLSHPYLDEVYEEELAGLKAELATLGAHLVSTFGSN